MILVAETASVELMHGYGHGVIWKWHAGADVTTPSYPRV
jgi:hypothetical protein